MKNNRIMRGIIALVFAVMMFAMTATAAFAFTDENAESETTPAATTEQEPSATLPPTTPTTPAALTPNGNLTLVDDISGGQSADKQFVTLITKNGNWNL